MPVGLETEEYKSRNVVELRFNQDKRWRGLATRYDRHATIYRATAPSSSGREIRPRSSRTSE